MTDIHQQDVKQLLFDNQRLVEQNRGQFEKYKMMSELISSIQSEQESNEKDEEEVDDEHEQEIESTSAEDIEEFNKWARTQAKKELSSFKHLVDLCDIDNLRTRISSLNYQQRRLFDDFSERMASTDINEKPFYLFLGGEAGTGKSYLVQLLIEAVKLTKLKAGADLQKPPLIVMAPTANAAFIVGGRTIDSALGFSPADINRYTQANPGKMATMQFQYEDVQMIFCDEISMVGSTKLAKINFRLQDLAQGSKKNEFMGGISFLASGKKLKE